MANQTDRINTIIALINSSSFSNSTLKNKIKVEFKQVLAVKSVTPPNRRNILKILHSTRALDTTLKSFLTHYGILGGDFSIGKYLSKLATHSHHSLGKLSVQERVKYQNLIAKVRNEHLHNADSYPRNEGEVYQLISEMEALISRVMTL